MGGYYAGELSKNRMEQARTLQAVQTEQIDSEFAEKRLQTLKTQEIALHGKMESEARAREDQQMARAAEARAVKDQQMQEVTHAERNVPNYTRGMLTIYPGTDKAQDVNSRVSGSGEPEVYDYQKGWVPLRGIPYEKAAEKQLRGEMTTAARGRTQEQLTKEQQAVSELTDLESKMNEATNFAGLPADIRSGLGTLANWVEQTTGLDVGGAVRDEKAAAIRKQAQLMKSTLMPVLTGDPSRFSDADVKMADQAFGVLSSTSSDREAKRAVLALKNLISGRGDISAKMLGYESLKNFRAENRLDKPEKPTSVNVGQGHAVGDTWSADGVVYKKFREGPGGVKWRSAK